MIQQLHKTAFTEGVPGLFHYERFNAGYLATTLREKIIHCSNPANLNDPWDCKPAFDPHALDDPESLERAIARQLEHPPKHLWAEQMRADPQARIDFIARESKSMETMLSLRGIYCLTPKSDSTLMWSHYAENHRGICLEFAVDNPLFGCAGKVDYFDEYPKWVSCDINDTPGRVMELILTKASDWFYEEEYRLVSVSPPPTSSFLQLHGDFFRLPEDALRSVIIGCEADHKAISSLIRQSDPRLSIKQAVRSSHRYHLEIVDYLG